MDILQRVESFIGEHRLLDDVKAVKVGFSGGPDSVALLLILSQVFDKVEAVHFNHGLRKPDGDEDEAWCKEFCRNHKIEFRSKTLDVRDNRQNGESIEMAGRRLRLEFWKRFVADQPETIVALGHHLDDKIETLLLRLIRGGNASGLTGLRHNAVVNGVRIIRPLLCIDKDEIFQLLNYFGVADYRVDKSNSDVKYTRNAIRKTVVPALLEISGAKRGLVTSLHHLGEDAAFIEASVRDQIEKYANNKLKIMDLLNLDYSLWSRFLRGWVGQNYGLNIIVGGRILKNLKKSICHSTLHGATFELNKEYNLRCDRGELKVESKKIRCFSKNIQWNWRTTPSLTIPEINVKLTATMKDASAADNADSKNYEYWHPDFLDDCLIVRPRAAGDRIIPWRKKTPVKVKKIISDAQPSIEEKRRMIVICNLDDEIVWLPPYRRANIGKISSECRYVVELNYAVIGNCELTDLTTP